MFIRERLHTKSNANVICYFSLCLNSHPNILSYFHLQLRQEGEPSMAVIAFIHFGGQLHGGPDALHQGPPDFIMHRDIVYVTIGYRLNIFGRKLSL